MSAAHRSARAALALAAALWAAALLAGPAVAPEPGACAVPGELGARDGRTVEAACGGGLAPLRGPARRLFGLPLDANAAAPATLETLPGIGPARAAAIVAERERRPFRSVADLARVHGIGPRTLERLAGEVAVDPHAGTLPETAGGSRPTRGAPIRGDASDRGGGRE